MKKKISLNGIWQMRPEDETEWISAVVPGSAYADLMTAGKMEDPFWRSNETEAFELMKKDYCYQRTVMLTASDLSGDVLLLTCEGLDTIADVFLNGQFLFHADNMHRTWVTDVKEIAAVGENLLEIRFFSPILAAKDAFANCTALGADDCTEGFPHIRKAHCMYGWDWGPRLPDAGIWRDIYLIQADKAILKSVFIHQKHFSDKAVLHFIPEIKSFTRHCDCSTHYTVISPTGEVYTSDKDELVIPDPLLWWPNGYGKQWLYSVKAELTDGCGNILDQWERRIGLRTMTMKREKDAFGESFETSVNGVSIFAMGADYIPEDNLLGRVTRDRTYRLLSDAKLANFNSVRVWGGGYYPDDWFYDACDELGLIVWQDFMFACACYELTDEFEENIRQEIIDNVRRLRHHASLGLWCGNNEMEMFVDQNRWVSSPKQKADYIRMYEYIMPKTLRKMDPDTFYWPASPSSGGAFDYPNDPTRGDVHYWDVWHGDKPFTEYRKFFFRYASEFGFQSFPCRKTIDSFTLPEDRNIFSYVMEKHQRNKSANGKIMNYLSQTYLYPKDFDTLLYASQLLQAEAIRYGVEHWRRNRGRCMGAIYWQLNDCWPVASWSSIDYYGRWKALHYAARRFFAPVLLSCEEEGTLSQRTNVNMEMPESEVEKSIHLNISNETMQNVHVRVHWALRNARAEVLQEKTEEADVESLSTYWLEKNEFKDADLYGNYVSYELRIDGRRESSGSVLFCAPKHFAFDDPELSVLADGNKLTVSAKAYARMVEIVCEDGDVLFEDNYFDLNAESREIKILRGSGTKFTVRSVYDIR